MIESPSSFFTSNAAEGNRGPHPYGLTQEQAHEAFAWYFTPEGRREVQLVLLRDFMREMDVALKPLPDMEQLDTHGSAVAFACSAKTFLQE
ncbi:hypothetical protein WDZ92_04310 [Nostoc sp. NIES-2111]